MKILIAYDGSESSDAAIVDLRRAGLPAEAEVSVLTLAAMTPQVAGAACGVLTAGPGMYFPEYLENETLENHPLEDAQAAASQAADRLRADFPQWNIRTEAWIDAAESAIIRKAHACKPDLIVVGSHGRSGINRLLLGSVSENVLHHATCPVRVSRHHLHAQDRGIRLVIGVDGSSYARAAVASVAARNWPKGTEVRVVGVLDSRIAISNALTPMGAMPTEIEAESKRRMNDAVDQAVTVLAKAGLRATPLVFVGKPCKVLLAEAEKWAADCIFVGARGVGQLERLLLGSVSCAVASKAHCSVEVVRK